MGLGVKLDGRMEFALVLAGLIHDVGHPGLTAPFLVASDDELALKYSEDSPLERMHLAVAFELLNKEKNCFLDKETITYMKKPIVRAVLGTDMANHEKQMQRLFALRDNLQHHGSKGTITWYWPAQPPPAKRKVEQDITVWELEEQVMFVLELYLHAADIASPTMPFDQFKRWNNLVQQEFHNQGDREKEEFGAFISAAEGYDRHAPALKLQEFTKGFVQFLVQPFFTELDLLTKLEAGTFEKKVSLQVDRCEYEASIEYYDELISGLQKEQSSSQFKMSDSDGSSISSIPAFDRFPIRIKYVEEVSKNVSHGVDLSVCIQNLKTNKRLLEDELAKLQKETS